MATARTDDEAVGMLQDMLSRLVKDDTLDAKALWRVLAIDLGVAGVLIDSGNGGLGGGATEAWAIMQLLGRASAWTPFLSSAVLAGGALKYGGGAMADRLQQAMATGSCTVSLAYLERGRRNAIVPQDCVVMEAAGSLRLAGRKTLALGAADADWLLVTAREADGGTSLFAIDSARVSRTPLATHDGAGAADITITDLAVGVDALVGERGQAMTFLDRALDDATVAACAAACGTLDAMLGQTIAHVKMRRQFGRTLAEFQVIQHRLVDLYVELEHARSLALVASAKLDGDPVERAEAVSGAKMLVAHACQSVSQGAVQFHGGIGTTEELPLARYFRRALMLGSLFGSADHHLKRYRRMGLLKNNSRDTILETGDREALA